MAITKVKRSVHKKQSAPSIKRSARPKPKTRAKPKQPKPRAALLPAPGQFALRERTLPGRRFVEFPLVKGKTAEKVEIYTTGEYHSITIDFQDQTTLNLEIQPSFAINAEFQQIKKGEVQTLAEWPAINSN